MHRGKRMILISVNHYLSTYQNLGNVLLFDISFLWISLLQSVIYRLSLLAVILVIFSGGPLFSYFES